MTRVLSFLIAFGFGAAAGGEARFAFGAAAGFCGDGFVATTGRCGAGELFSFGASPTIASATRSATAYMPALSRDNYMHSDAASQGGGWWQRCGAAYLARRARLAEPSRRPFAGDAIHSIAHEIEAGVGGGRRGVQVRLRVAGAQTRGAPPRDRDALANADAGTPPTPTANADSATTMACSAPNRFAERYPDHYGGLELPPLVARRSAGCGARNVYVDLGANWCNSLRLFAHVPSAPPPTEPWQVYAFEAAPLIVPFVERCCADLTRGLPLPRAPVPPTGSSQQLLKHARSLNCTNKGRAQQFSCIGRALNASLHALRPSPELRPTRRSCARGCTARAAAAAAPPPPPRAPAAAAARRRPRRGARTTG